MARDANHFLSITVKNEVTFRMWNYFQQLLALAYEYRINGPISHQTIRPHFFDKLDYELSELKTM